MWYCLYTHIFFLSYCIHLALDSRPLSFFGENPRSRSSYFQGGYIFHLFIMPMSYFFGCIWKTLELILSQEEVVFSQRILLTPVSPTPISSPNSSGKIVYTCNICQRTFTNPTNLNQHFFCFKNQTS